MKKIFTIISFTLLTGISFGQTPIIITKDEIPIPTYGFTVDVVTGLIPNPNPVADFSWDYSNIYGGVSNFVTYYPETWTVLTDFGIDVYQHYYKYLTPLTSPVLGYYIDNEFDFNDNAVEDKATYVAPQGYSLQSFTGNELDSIVFAEQVNICNTPKITMKFPFTFKDSWYSDSRRVADFTISIAQLGIKNAKATHIYHMIRHDTISGFGKLSVYTPNGPSKYYEVLADQITEYAIDSFLLNDSPAPDSMLTILGISQGQISNERNRLNVYREGTYQYLFSAFYGPNDHTTTPSNEFVNTDELVTSSSDPINGDYSVLIYPNPATTGDISLKVFGSIAEFNDYKIMDVMGRTISTGIITNSTGIIKISLPQNCVNGTYFVYLNDASGKTVINEEFVVQH